MATPTISGINPTSGAVVGGYPVVISGAGFNTPAVTSVTFGGTTATFTVNSDSQITATAPAHALGAVTVTVTNTSGSASTTFTYRTGPSVSPRQGTNAGGTAVDIYGSNLTGATAVMFGGLPAKSFTQVSTTHLQAVSPSGAGTVGVTVKTPGGTSGPANFYYLNPPVITALTPVAGPLSGGTTVTITGANLEYATSATFGGSAGTITASTGSSITVTTPAKASVGPVSAIVTTPGGSTNGLTFTYTAAPTITSLNPASGTTAGGDIVGITGTNLDTITHVTFGGTPVPVFAALTSTQLAVVTPAGARGFVAVTVTNPAGSATATGAFQYK